MISTYNSKAMDSLVDINVLKDQLGAVLKEISAFGNRLEKSKAIELRVDEFGYEERLRELKISLQAGKEPAKPVIFLTRMVVECLSRGAMSEKDIKTIVLERCKEVGIKSSNRGLIAGTGMDVATVCSVLSALGAIESIPPPDSSSKTEVDIGCGVNLHGTITTNHCHPVVSSSVPGCMPSVAIDSISGPGSAVYSVLTERWQIRITEYVEDALKSKLVAESEAAAEAAGGSGGAGRSISGHDPSGVAGVAVSDSTVSSVPQVQSVVGPSSTAGNGPAAVVPSYPVQSPPPSGTSSTNATLSGSTSAATATANANATAAVMSNTARLIAEYHSRNGLDQPPASAVATNNGSIPPAAAAADASVTVPSLVATSSNNTAVHQVFADTAQSSSNAAPKPPLQGSLVTSTNGISHSNTSGFIVNSHIPPAVLFPPSTAPNPHNLVSACHRGPLVDPNTTTTNPQQYAVPYNPSISAHATTHSNTTMNGAGTNINPAAPVYNTPIIPFAPNSTVTPATVGFLAVTQPTNKLVIPNFNINNLVSSNAVGAVGNVHSVLSSGEANRSNPLPTDSALLHSTSVANKTAPTVPFVANPAQLQHGAQYSVQYNSAHNLPQPNVSEMMGTPPLLPHSSNSHAVNPSMTTTTTNSTTTAKGKTAKTAAKPPVEKKPLKKTAAAAVKIVEAVHASLALVNTSASSSVTGVNSNKARRGPSALRVWKLREEYVVLDISKSFNSKSSTGEAKLANAALTLLLHPSLTLHTAAVANYNLHAALETEERLLRRLAGLCNYSLAFSSYRVGTTMLRDGEVLQPTRLREKYSSYTNSSSTAVAAQDSTSDEVYAVDAEPAYAIYDETTPITAAYLLDKVRRTKRQRGDCLYGNISLPYSNASASVSAARQAAANSVGVFSAPHIHALSAVCMKTTEYCWGRNLKKKISTGGNNHSSKSEPITMAQYARNLHTGVNSSGSIVLSSCSNGGNITSTTLKRYSQPLELTDAHLPMVDKSRKNVFAAATGGAHCLAASNNLNNSVSNNGSAVLCIPDLTLCTREIAWTAIASEFAVLQAPTEEGSIGFGYSASTALLDTFVNSNSTAELTTSTKKRKYLSNDGAAKASKINAFTGPNPAAVSGGGSGNANGLVLEVLAPQFTEIVPVTVLVQNMKDAHAQPPSESTDDEDTSDEAYGRRHEVVLQGMRDKWQRLQQLKNDALYGPGGAPPDSARGGSSYRAAGAGGGGGGYGGYFNRAATSGATSISTSATSASSNVELSPLGSPGFDPGNQFLNLSPRKRGLASAHAKRRGRPPKSAKNNNHANLSSNVSNTADKNQLIHEEEEEEGGNWNGDGDGDE